MISPGKESIWLLSHHTGMDVDDWKLLGIYKSEQEAMDARMRFEARPGFRDHPRGFVIDRYELNRDYWEEGFKRA